VVGKIPNFLGAEAAADYLAALPAWEVAQVLKANPDKAQRPIRVNPSPRVSCSTWRCRAWLTSCRSTCWIQRA
jgi:hypothetical protein